MQLGAWRRLRQSLGKERWPSLQHKLTVTQTKTKCTQITVDRSKCQGEEAAGMEVSKQVPLQSQMDFKETIAGRDSLHYQVHS